MVKSLGHTALNHQEMDGEMGNFVRLLTVEI